MYIYRTPDVDTKRRIFGNNKDISNDITEYKPTKRRLRIITDNVGDLMSFVGKKQPEQKLPDKPGAIKYSVLSDAARTTKRYYFDINYSHW